MTKTSLSAIECDHADCEQRRLITNGQKEGRPKSSWLSRGWVEITHRDADDTVAIETSHYCPDHSDAIRAAVDGDGFDGEVAVIDGDGSHTWSDHWCVECGARAKGAPGIVPYCPNEDCSVGDGPEIEKTGVFDV